MARAFYPFVEEGDTTLDDAVRYPARIAVYDDAAAAPRVVEVEPQDVRSYLEEITATVNRLAREQGSTLPFTVIREIVENFVHAYFVAPTISILDGGNTIRFSDQGPGIQEKERALEYGTTSATEEMKRYIRGVGSGLPYVKQYMLDKGGSLTIEDNMSSGAVVTISTRPSVSDGDTGRGAEATGTPDGRDARATGGRTHAAPTLDERGEAVVAYLADHGQVGPTELVREHGRSAATWSRTLAALEAAGVVRKRGQKYVLTTLGEGYL